MKKRSMKRRSTKRRLMGLAGGGSRSRKKARRAADPNSAEAIHWLRATSDFDLIGKHTGPAGEFATVMKAALRQAKRTDGSNYGLCANLREAKELASGMRGSMGIRARSVLNKVQKKYGKKCRRAT